MPTFIYKAVDSQGTVLNGSFDASNRSEVISSLKQQGLWPLEIESGGEKEIPLSGASIIIKKGKKRRGKIGLRERLIFTHQLGTLLAAGLPLSRALTVLEDQSDNSNMADMIADLKTSIEGGISFPDSLSKYPNVFSPLYTNMVKVGEISGRLDIVLKQLSRYLQSEHEIKNQVLTALLYPVMIVGIGMVSVIFLFVYVIPKLILAFEQLDVPLPLPTKIVIGISNLLVSYWWLILLAIGGSVYLLNKYWKSSSGRMQLEKILFRIPLFGSLWHRLQMARFSRTMGTLVGSGIPVLPTLELLAKTSISKVISGAIISSTEKIQKGEAIATTLSSTGVFPGMMTSLIAVGEESGELEAMLNQIAETYEMETEAILKRFLSLFEPLLIVGMAIVVGAIVLSFLLPILTISENLET